MLKHINNLGIASNPRGDGEWEAHKLNKMLLEIRKKNREQKRMALNNVPEVILKQHQDLLQHMNDFLGNKVRLGKIVHSSSGGPTGAVPIHSPRDGILNMQYTINEIEAKRSLISDFLVKKLNEIETYSKWLLFNQQSLCSTVLDFLNSFFIDPTCEIKNCQNNEFLIENQHRRTRILKE